MKIRQGLEKLGSFGKSINKSKGRKSLLVALSVLLSLNIVLAAMPGRVFAQNDGVDSMTELVAAIENADKNVDTVINISGSFEIYDTIEIESYKGITLSPVWGSYTLSRGAGFDDALFSVNGIGASIKIDGGLTIDGDNSSAGAPLITAENYGCVILNGGTLQNNMNLYCETEGGAINAVGGATVTVLDGVIQYNYSYKNGGAVALSGGSTFIMNDGELNDNKAYTGGAIYAEDSKVVIKNGDIISNTAEYKGGGAYFTGCNTVNIGVTDANTSVNITDNSAPIGAGLYYCSKPAAPAAPDYTISGLVVIDDNYTAYSSELALPDGECNLFMETALDVPEVKSLKNGASIGLYPMEHNTVISTSTDYYKSHLTLDHDADYLDAYITHTASSLTIGATPAISILAEVPTNGKIISDMGDCYTDQGALLAYAGFPVHLAARPDSGYILAKDTDDNEDFCVLSYTSSNEGATTNYLAYGTAQNGLWYTFTDSSAKVRASFAAADVVASVDGVNYTDLEAAFNDCIGKRNAVITLEAQEIVLNDAIYFSGNDNIVLRAGSAEGDYIIKRDQNFYDYLFCLMDGTQLTLDSVTLSGNILVSGAEPVVAAFDAELKLVNGSCIIDGHGLDRGGAVYLSDSTLVIGTGCNLRLNSANYGGAVYMYGDSAVIGDGDPTTSEIYGNEFSEAGGGIYMNSGVVSGCDVSANTPEDGATDTVGGGIYMISGQVINSTVGASVDKDTGVSNQAKTGAGIYVVDGKLENVEVRNNSASSEAGGVYYENSLMLSGKVLIKDNKSAGSPSNLRWTENKPVKVIGDLAEGSVVNVKMPASASAKTIAVCESGEEALDNAAVFALDGTTGMNVVSSHKEIVTAAADKCATVVLEKTQNSKVFECDPALGTAMKVLADDCTIYFDIECRYDMIIDLKLLDEAGNEVAINYNMGWSYDDESKLYSCDVSPSESLDPGKTYKLVIDASYEYYDYSISQYVPITDREVYGANNYDYYSEDVCLVYYSASKLNSYAKLDAEFVKWGDGVRSVKDEMYDALEGNLDGFDGYVRLEPYAESGAAALGSLTDVPEVTISVDVSRHASDGDTIDIVSYSGVEAYETSGGGVAGGATLHKGLVVKDGKVSFKAPRGTGDTADIVYFGMVNHPAAAASIGTYNYASLLEAVDDAEDGDTIKLLADAELNSAIVVKDGIKLTITAVSPMSITRGSNYDDALIFVDDGGELILENIVLDGGADITSAKPLTNSGSGAYASMVVNYGTLTVKGNGAFINAAVTENYYERGGALFNAGEAEISNADFEGCYASKGGAIYNDGTLTLDGCAVKNNIADSEGGAIYSSGTLTLVDTTVTENINIGTGIGGIYNSGELELAGSVCVTSNSDKNGGRSNVCNDSEEPIALVDDLSVNAMIGVSYPDQADSVVAEGDGKNVRDASDFAANFFPDVINKAIVGESKKVVIDTAREDYVTVTITAGENGTALPYGEIRLPEESNLVVTTAPDVGYATCELTVDDTSVFADADFDENTGVAEYEIEDIDDDVDVAVSFKRTPTSVIVPSASSGGTITPSVPVKVNSEESVDFIIKPNAGSSSYDGYYLESLKLNGKDVIDKAVRNADGTYTYTMSDVTDASNTLNATFMPIYADRVLMDNATGVQLEGKLHYQAYLTVENLSEYYPNRYTQMLGALTSTSTYTQYIAQAYEIRLNFQNEVEMANVPKYLTSDSLDITFNLGTSYKDKTVRVFHTVGNDVDTTSHIIAAVPESGIITVTTDSLSPYAIVVQEEVKSSGNTGGTGNSGSGTNSGTNGSSTSADGKGPVSGDKEPRTIPPVVIVLLVLSSATIVYIVSKYYLPKFIATIRCKYGTR